MGVICFLFFFSFFCMMFVRHLSWISCGLMYGTVQLCYNCTSRMYELTVISNLRSPIFVLHIFPHPSRKWQLTVSVIKIFSASQYEWSLLFNHEVQGVLNYLLALLENGIFSSHMQVCS